MDKSFAVVFLAGALGLAGCAADPQTAAAPASAKAKPERSSTEYVTGSRIPRKDAGDQMISRTSKEEYRDYKGEGQAAGPKGN